MLIRSRYRLACPGSSALICLILLHCKCLQLELQGLCWEIRVRGFQINGDCMYTRNPCNLPTLIFIVIFAGNLILQGYYGTFLQQLECGYEFRALIHVWIASAGVLEWFICTSGEATSACKPF